MATADDPLSIAGRTFDPRLIGGAGKFGSFQVKPGAPAASRARMDAGCATVMPLGSWIGSNQGVRTRDAVRIIVEQATVPVVVDAGLGAPSHAAEAMELGVDAVLVNTAIAVAGDPVAMARAFRLGVEAGRRAHLARGAPARG